MNFNTMTREDMATFIKRLCVEVAKDIPDTPLKAGECYFFEQFSHGISLFTDDLSEEHWISYSEAEEYLKERDNNANA